MSGVNAREPNIQRKNVRVTISASSYVTFATATHWVYVPVYPCACFGKWERRGDTFCVNFAAFEELECGPMPT